MEVVQFVLPTCATLALGLALFVPLRDDRRGKRATLSGTVPLRPDFRIVAPVAAIETMQDGTETPTCIADPTSPDLVEFESQRAVRCDKDFVSDAERDERERTSDETTIARRLPEDGRQDRTTPSALRTASESQSHPHSYAYARSEPDSKSYVHLAELNEPLAAQHIPASADALASQDVATTTWTHVWRRIGRYLGRTSIAKRGTSSNVEDKTHSCETASSEPTDLSRNAQQVGGLGETETTIERSFADELGRLLRPNQGGDVVKTDCESQGSATSEASEASGTTCDVPPQWIDSASSETPAVLQPRDDPPAALRTDSDTDIISRRRILAADPSSRIVDHPIESQPPSTVSAIAVERIRQTNGRVVPLTRLPLRPKTDSITWPTIYESARTELTDAERHALLSRTIQGSIEMPIDILELAYAQESAEGRVLALRASATCVPTSRTRALFVEASVSGTDEERSFALDALAKHGERSDYIGGLTDRIDAIAARAALSYVGTYERATYYELLAPYLDRARIESRLVVLAGIVE